MLLGAFSGETVSSFEAIPIERVLVRSIMSRCKRLSSFVPKVHGILAKELWNSIFVMKQSKSVLQKREKGTSMYAKHTSFLYGIIT